MQLTFHHSWKSHGGALAWPRVYFGWRMSSVESWALLPHNLLTCDCVMDVKHRQLSFAYQKKKIQNDSNASYVMFYQVTLLSSFCFSSFFSSACEYLCQGTQRPVKYWGQDSQRTKWTFLISQGQEWPELVFKAAISASMTKKLLAPAHGVLFLKGLFVTCLYRKDGLILTPPQKAAWQLYFIFSTDR